MATPLTMIRCPLRSLSQFKVTTLGWICTIYPSAVPILYYGFNVHTLTMTFTHMGLPITLHADAPPTPSTASAHPIKRLAQTQSISSLFHITATQTPSSPPPSYIPPPPQLTAVLDRYFHIFADPTQLPPSHNI